MTIPFSCFPFSFFLTANAKGAARSAGFLFNYSEGLIYLQLHLCIFYTALSALLSCLDLTLGLLCAVQKPVRLIARFNYVAVVG